MGLIEREVKGEKVSELPQGTDKYAQRYLNFWLDNEEYAIELSEIKEVIIYMEVTEVPNITPYIRGVISLRGVIIPVLDFKKCLGLSGIQHMQKPRIVIISHKKYIAGLPVDSVKGVINVSSDMVNPIPRFMERERIEFLKGVIEYKDRFVMLIKTDTLLEYIKNEN